VVLALGSIRRWSSALWKRLVRRFSCGNRMRYVEVVSRICLALVFLNKFALRFVMICEVGKVNRVPACGRRRAKAQASELPWHHLVLLRIVFLIPCRKIMTLRLACGLGHVRIVPGMVAAVELLCMLLRCSTCLVRGLKCKIARCCARTVGHWLATPGIASHWEIGSFGAEADFGSLRGRKVGGC
jgi:hypothetical protein